MKKIILLSFVIVAVLSAQPQMPEFIETSSPFVIDLDYIVELPPGYDPTDTVTAYPLIIALHGFGDHAGAYKGTAMRLCPEGAIGLYPETAFPVNLEGSLGWAWYMWGDSCYHRETVELSTRWVLQILEQVKQEYAVDSTKVFLFGFSQGGMMTYQVGIQYPHLFRGLLPAGGWLEVPIDEAHPLDSAALNLPVRALHGAYDEVVSWEDGKAAVDTLSRYGARAEIISYPAGHTLIPELFDDARDFVYCLTQDSPPPALVDILWPRQTLEPGEHVEILRKVLCATEPMEDIEAGLLGLEETATSPAVKEMIIYLLGARRCVGSEYVLKQILQDENKPQILRKAAYSALIKLGTETAWTAIEGIEKHIVIQEVVPGSQANEVGLLPGDVIVRYNRKRIDELGDIQEAKDKVADNQEEVVMIIERDGEKERIKLAPGQIGIRLTEGIK
ncbi:PDZ domain-containing protein [candidate division WOR-3 bacterium]|uniref:PDZ domain-containing protein n=1 Tax=candidate division WOR-3 bacterium TaxID=2052148 RepID=A0A9D5QD45_UNCW3|nr:PDZ domain-containing protein [candidate division WOR-3 bacterium]MBD3364722.1 PDZ domain-containing protein [candidate division WOR-3 bacterium]